MPERLLEMYETLGTQEQKEVFDFTMYLVSKKNAEKTCNSLEEVRANIDRIDDAIIRLIAERGGFVAQAASFKKDADGVRDTARVEKVIQKVRAKAAECGANADMVEALWREMICRFVELEMREFSAKR